MKRTPFEVYAVRYATSSRNARDNFLYDPQHSGAMPLDYFIWVLVGPEHTIVVDLGFDHAGAARRGRVIERLPSAGLAHLGIDAATVTDVIITHLHYDHAGDLASFPAATLHVQSAEVAFATGSHMNAAQQRMAFDVEYVCDFVRAVYAERVHFIDGDEELVPGISVHHVGGHTAGQQVVRVWTNSGWLVLASDAMHLYANRDLQNPFPIIYDLDATLAGYRRLHELADAPELIIPGHDPLVCSLFPATIVDGNIFRLDQGPLNGMTADASP